MKLGIYPNLSNEDYHKDPALSKGMLDKLAISAAHYKDAMERKAEPTPIMMFGAAFHCAQLEPDRFKKEYISMSEGLNKRNKDGKVFLEQHKDKIILSYDDNEAIKNMIKAINNNVTARSLLSKGESEVSYFWKHKLGFMCKDRPDHRQDDILIDLKTTADALPNKFSKSIADFKYHWQAAWYIEGVRANGIDVKYFLIITVEKTPPYALAVYRISPEDIYLAEEEIKPLLDLYVECRTTDTWPAYPDKVQVIDLPAWYIKTAKI